ncbi:MAG: hypothetical protein E6Q97_24730 [Desulfurellales bacterium]|nr:MAG: hypothetical protein E6Q97_24730 [Desulfurellales bacterium]
MADTVDNRVIRNGKYYVTRHINYSDGTGETGVVKVDLSAITRWDGRTPVYSKIDRIEFNIAGMSVRLHWDHTTDDEIVVLPPGSGIIDVEADGGLVDPRTTGDTGDILFTTVGAGAGDSYDITLYTKLKV